MLAHSAVPAALSQYRCLQCIQWSVNSCCPPIQAANSPLHCAVVEGDVDTVRVLLANSADVSAGNIVRAGDIVGFLSEITLSLNPTRLPVMKMSTLQIVAIIII
jgi:ankyrin repeat protein